MTDYNIHKLSYKNNLNKIKKIVEKDKKLLYKKGINGEYPIHIACFIGSKKLIKLNLLNELRSGHVTTVRKFSLSFRSW